MEAENVSSSTITSSTNNEGEGHDVRLPGFRFHPTDEELCGFYLRRKVEKRPISIELIKQADIYKFDPWDLPTSGNVGEREWYFFCKRGRKYRNSIRPNRVTASGFWKATGIDRPVYSSGGEGLDCIGLKKSLVYYRGSAGKGSKTDWMMHEFRLPAAHDKTIARLDAKIIAQEAEVWTLCRIFKRNVSHRKCLPAWRGVPSKRSTAVDANSKTCSSVASSDHQSNYISFNAPPITTQPDQKPSLFGQTIPNHEQLLGHVSSSSVMFEAPSEFGDINEMLRHVGWEDLPSIVGCAASNHYSPFD